MTIVQFRYCIVVVEPIIYFWRLNLLHCYLNIVGWTIISNNNTDGMQTVQSNLSEYRVYFCLLYRLFYFSFFLFLFIQATRQYGSCCWLLLCWDGTEAEVSHQPIKYQYKIDAEEKTCFKLLPWDWKLLINVILRSFFFSKKNDMLLWIEREEKQSEYCGE